MKKKQKPTFGSLGILIGVLVLGAIVYSGIDTTSTKSAEFKTHTSQALRISFEYPKDWNIIGYPNFIILGNNQSSLNFGNNVYLTPPTKRDISIKITLIHSLQNQTLLEFIKESDKTSILSKEFKGKNIDDNEAIIRESSYMINSSKLQYITIYVEKNNNIYTISATPADSELIPIFNKIVNSIEFQ